MEICFLPTKPVFIKPILPTKPVFIKPIPPTKPVFITDQTCVY